MTHCLTRIITILRSDSLRFSEATISHLLLYGTALSTRREETTRRKGTATREDLEHLKDRDKNSSSFRMFAQDKFFCYESLRKFDMSSDMCCFGFL